MENLGSLAVLLAFCLAKRTHAPGAFGLFESGVIRATPSPNLLYTMCDPPNIAGATACTSLMTVMALLQRGDVNVGFIGGAEIDRFGNVNTTLIGSQSAPTIRLQSGVPGLRPSRVVSALSRLTRRRRGKDPNERR